MHVGPCCRMCLEVWGLVPGHNYHVVECCTWGSGAGYVQCVGVGFNQDIHMFLFFTFRQDELSTVIKLCLCQASLVSVAVFPVRPCGVSAVVEHPPGSRACWS